MFFSWERILLGCSFPGKGHCYNVLFLGKDIFRKFFSWERIFLGYSSHGKE
jgi:hypothetical protein